MAGVQGIWRRGQLAGLKSVPLGVTAQRGDGQVELITRTRFLDSAAPVDELVMDLAAFETGLVE